MKQLKVVLKYEATEDKETFPITTYDMQYAINEAYNRSIKGVLEFISVEVENKACVES